MATRPRRRRSMMLALERRRAWKALAATSYTADVRRRDSRTRRMSWGAAVAILLVVTLATSIPDA